MTLTHHKYLRWVFWWVFLVGFWWVFSGFLVGFLVVFTELILDLLFSSSMFQKNREFLKKKIILF